jgi:chorismate-pyruvate lyase
MSVLPHNPIDLLFPLNRFYASQGLPLPRAQALAGPAVPQPFRDLLVHARDMTPTLEAFFREIIALTVLHSNTVNGVYSREVILHTAQSGLPVEYGSIDICVANFAPIPRARIMSNALPLGSILARDKVAHLSAPYGFFSLPSDALMERHFQLQSPATLYGRRNRLLTPDGRTLAEVVEIITPAAVRFADAQAQQQQQ